MLLGRNHRSESDPQPITFRMLAAREGIEFLDPLQTFWPLEKWFAAIVDIPISEFSHFDLARSCRQEIHLDTIVPFCLNVLETQPLSGELYDGELLAAVIRLPCDYWETHPIELAATFAVARVAVNESDDVDLNKKIVDFFEKHDEEIVP